MTMTLKEMKESASTGGEKKDLRVIVLFRDGLWRWLHKGPNPIKQHGYVQRDQELLSAELRAKRRGRGLTVTKNWAYRESFAHRNGAEAAGVPKRGRFTQI